MTVDWRARVLDRVDAGTEAMVEALSTLVRLPSVTASDAEHDAQAHLAARMTDDGLDVDHWRLPIAELEGDPAFPGMEVPRAEGWGLLGRLPGRGDGPTLLLQGHVDVVPVGDVGAWTVADPFSGRVVATTMQGRGTCDMKAGLVAAHYAVRALRASDVPLRGDVLLASVVGEEDGGLGTFGLIRRGVRADACVIPEPTGLDVVPACAGAFTFRLRVRGKATHASRRTEGVSAIEKLWVIWTALAELERRRNADVDPLMARWPIAYALSIGIVHAGDWASSVPDLLEADGRYGVALDEDPADARRELEDAVAEACARDDWLRDHPAEVEWWGGQLTPGRLPPDSDLVYRVMAAHRAVSPGSPAPEVWGAPYGSDLRLLTGLAGIPTLHYGPGDVAVAHGPDESVPLAEVRTAARALAVLALDVCGVA